MDGGGMGKGTHAHACAHTWSAVGQREKLLNK